MRKIYTITIVGIGGDEYMYSSYNNSVIIEGGEIIIHTTIKGIHTMRLNVIRVIQIDESF